jgi:hypothetical protein
MEGNNVIEVKPSYVSEVHRALIVLGFSEAERSKAIDLDRTPIALKTFSSWIDRVQSLPIADEELKATWSEFMRARFGGSEPPMTPTAVNEAAHAAHYAITMQLQLFPPRARRDYEDNQSYAAEWTELSAWRAVAKSNGFDSPEDLASVQAASLKQFADDRIVKEWQLATGCRTSADAKAFRSAWCTETNCMFPIEAGNKIRSLQARADQSSVEWSEVEHWKTETGCLTATGAGELIKSFRAANVDLQSNVDELSAKLHERDQDLLSANAEIDRVKKAAHTLGLVSDHSAELAKVRAELQSKQRECQTEKERADRVEKKAYEQNERAGRAESAANTRRVLLEKIGEALQLNTPALWDPLPGQVEELRKRASTAESMFKVEQQKHDDTKKELLAANQFVRDHSVMWRRMSAAIGLEQTDAIDIVAWIEGVQKKLANAIIPLPKPEKVELGQRWAIVSTVGYVYGSITGDYPVDLSSLGTVQEKQLLTSESWSYLG